MYIVSALLSSSNHKDLYVHVTLVLLERGSLTEDLLVIWQVAVRVRLQRHSPVNEFTSFAPHDCTGEYSGFFNVSFAEHAPPRSMSTVTMCQLVSSFQHS